MFDYGKILMTLAVCSIIMFSSSAGRAWTDDQGRGPAATGTTKQGGLTEAGTADQDGDGVPNCEDPDWTGPVGDGIGTAYQHRNTWNHRNVTQNRYGDMGENPGSGQRRGFVDEDGDGINDRARDHDGDGLPNGKDPDWVRNKRDGTGAQAGGSLSQGSKRCLRSETRGNKGSQ